MATVANAHLRADSRLFLSPHTNSVQARCEIKTSDQSPKTIGCDALKLWLKTRDEESFISDTKFTFDASLHKVSQHMAVNWPIFQLRCLVSLACK